MRVDWNFKHKRLARFSLSILSILLVLCILRTVAPELTYLFAGITLVGIVAFLVLSAGIRWASTKRHFHNLYRREL